MGVLSSILGTSIVTPQVGISNGDKPGHVGIWVNWDPAQHPTEVFRVVVRMESITGLRVDPVSYTFAPSFDGPFCSSIETTYEMKEFLTGRYSVKNGNVYLDCLLSGTTVISSTVALQDFVKCIRQKGPEAPSRCKVIEGYIERDKPEIAALKHSDLKAHSDAIRKEIADKLAKAEEERKAKEAAAADAAKKAAAAASAGSAKAAAPKSDGPTITGGKIAVFYGSSTGNTEGYAKQIKEEIGADHIKNVTDCHPLDFLGAEILILGIPTWHIGELQDDWAAALPDIAKNNYAGKKVAIFGLGDQKGYPDTYVDAMAELLEPFEKTGAKLYGLWPTDGYDFKKSKAIRDGKFLGVVIDVENQDNLSDKRIKAWIKQLKAELGL